jgi:hypothetical protein
MRHWGHVSGRISRSFGFNSPWRDCLFDTYEALERHDHLN